MPEFKYVAGKEGIQELWRRIRAEIGKFNSFQPAEAAPDGTPDIPLAERKTNIIYLVPVSGSPDPDHYMEWIWTEPSDGLGYWECTGDTTQDLSGYALKSEMSVEPGTGADADKTTITLKEGTSATVLTAHQDLSGKADKVSGGTAGHFASLDSNGNLVDSTYAPGSFKDKGSQATYTNDSGTKTVDSVEQDANGNVTVTYKEIQAASTSGSGLVQLEDSHTSTSTTTAATPKNVKEAYDLASGKYSLPSGGIPSTDMTSAVQASLGKADSAIQHVYAGQEELVPVSQTVTIPYATDNTGGLITDNMAGKLSGIEANAEVNVQSDWTELDTTADAFIQNKPSVTTVTISGTTYLRTYDDHSVYAARTDCDKEGNDLTLGIDGTTNTVTDTTSEPLQDSSGNSLADAESDARVVSIGELPIWADRAEKDASGNDIESTYAAQTVIDNDYSPEDTYRYGDTCMHEGTLYVCTEPGGIGTPETWTPAHWASTNIAEQIRNLQEAMKMPKYLKTQEIVTYTLTGTASTATKSPVSDVVLQLTRMDDGVGGTNLISAAVPVTISKSQVTMGGAGAILSRNAKAAVLDISIVIPSAYAASGDTPVGSFKLSIGEWSRWEDKNIVLPITASDTDWSENYRIAKPVTLVATTTTTFYIEDFNIQDDFKNQELPVYVELGIKTDKLTSADGTALID